MKGDFTRGHNPDLQRGKRYRRILLQQGRVLLDSDHAATMGAMDRNLRELGQDLGCAAGGSDYGFLLTPGKLYALFDDLDRITDSSDVEVTRDYQLKYLNRYPSIHIEGTGVGPGYVEIELFTPHTDGDLTIWCRGEVQTTFTVEDQDANQQFDVIADPGEFVAKPAKLEGVGVIRIVVDPGEHVWIALIESAEDKPEPSFWLAPGRFHLGGLIFENPTFTPWPQQAFPAELGFALTPISDRAGDGGFFVAYLEGWERLHTHLHDRGIREEALGGLDTTVRTEALGQVKILWVADQPELLALRTALSRPIVSDGTLEVQAADGIDDPDPCALPVEGGYSGPDNRLYHFEVHVGGGLDEAQFKWSRDNGSELFRVVERSGAVVYVAAGTGLQDGDLVELIGDIIELGDAEEAVYAGGQFTPAVRRVGELALLLRESEAADDLGRELFKLIDLDSGLPFSPDVALYPDDQPMLLRRWHGLFTATEQVELEHGVSLELSGTQYVVGDWWEWQARVLQDNDNGEFQTSPHGPERLFAPLAVLENDTDPLVLQAWADDRFVGLCDLDADHIPFDGLAVGSNADSVQEALVELYEHTEFAQPNNCCGVEFAPDPFSEDPDQQRLAELLLAALPNGGVVCLAKGTYTFDGSLDLNDLGGGQAIGGNLTLKGCNDVLIVQTTDAPLFRVPPGRVLQLEGLVLLSEAQVFGTNAAPAAQVRLDGHRAVFDARACMFVMLAQKLTAVVFDGAPMVTPPPLGEVLVPIGNNTPSVPAPNNSVLLRDCVLMADHGIRCQALGRLLIDRTAIRFHSSAAAVAHIGQIELRHSTLTDSLNPAVDLAGVNFSTVLARRHRLAEIALDFSDTITTGYGVLAAVVYGGRIFDCRISAYVPIFADLLWYVQVTDSQLRSLYRGVRVCQAVGTTLSGLQVVAQTFDGIAIEIYVRDTTIERCTVEATARRGIDVGSLAAADTVDVIGCKVVDNHVVASGSGIRLGPDNPALGNMSGILVSGNRVVHFGNLLGNHAIRVTRHVGESAGTEGVLIAGNTTLWRGSGISGVGSDISIVGNNVTIFEQGVGVSLVDGRQSAIKNNTILGRAGLQPDSITGMEVTGCQYPHISSNTVAPPLADNAIRPLSMSDCDNPRISDNMFQTGTCLISECQTVSLLGNLFYSGVWLDLCFSGDIVNNRVEDDFANDNNPSVESILCHQARGIWNVANNYALDSIRLIPLLTPLDDDPREYPLFARVTGNNCKRLQIGYHLPFLNMSYPNDWELTTLDLSGFPPDNNTTVIVTNNVCFEGLIINEYNNMIVAHNAVDYLSPNIPGQSNKVEIPNIHAP